VKESGLTFCCCDKIPKINNLKEERFILAHGFRGFNSWLLGLTAFVPVVRQTLWQGVHVRGGCSPHSGQEAKTERHKGVCISMSPIRAHHHITWISSTRPHLQNVPIPPNSATLGTKPLTHESLGDIPNSKYSRSSLIAWVINNEELSHTWDRGGSQRNSKHKKDSTWHCWHEDRGGHLRRTAGGLTVLRKKQPVRNGALVPKATRTGLCQYIEWVWKQTHS
jgi:hypothetical protein